MDNERFAALEAHYNAILPTLATKADIEALRAEMHKMSADTHKWMVASLIGLFIGFGGLGITLSQILKPTAQATTQMSAQPPQPIIIYLPQPTAAPQK
ncbi:hypothetical protein D0T25_31015 [Duganella sp. BJB488]|uniref:Uncharacterized protein n=1 Tax=Duganella vulcania TaxID=2692166 RepID=A0A845HPW3_9BURK|nr:MULTISPECIES: hypothetical protein [Duganella]MYN18904.1 hypothetical protein [Duganella vulcania]RFP09044.1 hypothetical protein D0T26_30690 [Duganella sp. BJB489]RFP11834.1 hypothetical protein D0T25_31015 [Duganella sp. BJB488]RFP29037.1 hypothetical protein D0T24_31175 [Duganella sp. BJB480]